MLLIVSYQSLPSEGHLQQSHISVVLKIAFLEPDDSLRN